MNFPAGLAPNSIAIGDFNGDGRPDLAVSNLNSDDVTLLRGRGDGTFISLGAVIVGSSPTSVKFEDFNGDGMLDLAVARNGPPPRSSGFVAVLLGNGNGSFQPAVSYATGGSNASSLAVGDFNGDGVVDLAVTQAGSNNVSVLLGLGDGTPPTA